MGVFENKNYNYSLMEIKDENERKAVRKAKMEAVKEFFKVDTITELGTGSGGRTIVYQVTTCGAASCKVINKSLSFGLNSIYSIRLSETFTKPFKEGYGSV